MLLKQTVTSCSVGVTAPFDVVSAARYSRYRWPLNCASELPLVKKVAAVPSGPTKLNGPLALSPAAAWNLTFVPAGVVAIHDSAPQFTIVPAGGLASFTDDVNVP